MPIKDQDKYSAYQKKWRDKNKEHLSEYSKQYREKNKERLTNNAVVYHRERLLASKQELYELLGDSCNRCGFSDVRALQVHHVSRDGYDVRKKFRNLRYIKYMIDEAKTQKESGICVLELLCANCHAIEHFNDRLCVTKRIAKITMNVGGAPGKTKLTEQQVRDIRRKHDNGMSISSLIREYDVTKNTISRIVNLLSWKWVK